MEKKTYTVTEFAEKIGLSVKTLQRWDREGILKAGRTPTNRRYYTEDHYEVFLGLRRSSAQSETGTLP